MYQKITQEAEGQLFGRRFTWDKYEGAEMDFDVLNDYTVYAHATASYIAEYIPTGMAYGAFATVEEALGCIKEKILEKQEAAKKIEAATEKFSTVVKSNSLDERYKDVNPEKKLKKVKTMWYIENLQNKARIRTEELHADNQEKNMERNQKLSEQDYLEMLVNH